MRSTTIINYTASQFHMVSASLSKLNDRVSTAFDPKSLYHTGVLTYLDAAYGTYSVSGETRVSNLMNVISRPRVSYVVMQGGSTSSVEGRSVFLNPTLKFPSTSMPGLLPHRIAYLARGYGTLADASGDVHGSEATVNSKAKLSVDSSGKISITDSMTGFSCLSGSGAFKTQDWNMVLAFLDSAVAQIYVNGRLVARKFNSVGPSAPSVAANFNALDIIGPWTGEIQSIMWAISIGGIPEVVSKNGVWLTPIIDAGQEYSLDKCVATLNAATKDHLVSIAALAGPNNQFYGMRRAELSLPRIWYEGPSLRGRIYSGTAEGQAWGRYWQVECQLAAPVSLMPALLEGISLHLSRET